MIKRLTILFVISLVAINGIWFSEADGKDYYRTFEIIGKSENSLILQDNDGNVVEVDKDTENYKVGYKVRYDSVRNRIKSYRWQDYVVREISGQSITLQHKTGDILTLTGNFTREYDIGDQVRYDSVDDKLQTDNEAGQWQQYTVVAADRDKITLRSNDGQEVTLYLDNNIYKAPRGLFIPRYKVGDPIRYNASADQLRKGEIRTYDWQDYEVARVTENQLALVNEDNEELVLENTYGIKLKAGDLVKYDRLNNLLKKSRK